MTKWYPFGIPNFIGSLFLFSKTVISVALPSPPFKLSLPFLLYIQGDSGGICNTSGIDSMCDSKQKSSYKHVSDFRRLRCYGHFLIPVHALMWTTFALPADSPPPVQTEGGNATDLIRMSQRKLRAIRARSSQPSGSLFCGRRWHFRKPPLSTDQFKLKVISWS